MAPYKMDELEVLSKALMAKDVESPILSIVKAFAEKLMAAEADARCGAAYGERDPDRVNQRNGFRERRWDTQAGTVNLEIPKLRQGAYFPHWLLEPRKRADKALCSVVVQCYQRGVSTRRVDGLVKAMGIEGMSKSQVSILAQELDEVVEEFRNRPLCGHYPYLWVDALYHKVREGGRIVSVATVVAVGVHHSGKREILGVDVFTGEDGPSWLAFLRGLSARGLSGVRNITSDAHQGLVSSIPAVFPGATWQRCRTHFMRNLLTRVPKASQDMVATLTRSIFSQPDAKTVQEQHARVIDQLEHSKFGKAAQMLAQSGHEILSFSAYPKEHWRQIWSNNPQERLNKEIRRRTDVVGIFPNREALIRLVGAVLAEQHDEWQVTRCYLNVEKVAEREEPEKVTPALAPPVDG